VVIVRMPTHRLPRRFIIVANSLKDPLGHYLETSLAIAEAARARGMRPVIGVHATCPPDLFPEWLPCFPLFRTDHWMAGPPAAAATHLPMPADPYAEMRGANIDATWARLLGLPMWWLDRAAYYLMPPRLMRDGSGWSPRILSRAGLAQLSRGVSRRLSGSRIAATREAPTFARSQNPDASDVSSAISHPLIEAGLAHSPIRRPVTDAYHRAKARNHVEALEHVLIFKQDLERFLAIACPSTEPSDHVFLGTAHARELFAIQLVIRQLGRAFAPRFHLEFRHPVFERPPTLEEYDTSPRVFWQRFFFELYEDWGPSSRIRLYTDTERLSAEYRWLHKPGFQVLPIPFRNQLLDEAISAQTRSDSRLTLGFFGGARDEKGFHRLAELVNDLNDDLISSGRVRILAQATFIDPGFNPRSADLLEKWRRRPPKGVTLVGLDGPLSPADYYRLVSETDIALLPYDENRYRNASSGTLAEAIAAGLPVIVPANTWLAEQVDPDAAVLFTDHPSFIQGVRQLVSEYPSYRATALRHAGRWRLQHSPDALIQSLLGRRGHR